MHGLFLLFVGIILLLIGGEFLVKSSVAISLKLRLSRIVIGMTVVSFSTSVPELIVSVMAGLKGHSNIALGNVIGSNIANIGLVLGLTAILIPIWVKRATYRYNWPMMMVMSLLLWWFLYTGRTLSSFEGLILFVLLISFTFYIIRRSYKDGDVEDDDYDAELHQAKPFYVLLWFLVAGLGMYFGSRFLVDGAVELARLMGISERVISLSLVAVGTSLPELAASVISAAKKEKDLSLGNLIGSNIFNIGSVLGITAMIKPISHFEPSILQSDIFWMLGISALVVPLALLPPKNKIHWWKGVLLVSLYALFIWTAFA
jgi:cation:H+ antiporter